MKISVVIPVLNSHEIVRRQLLHFSKMGWPRDCELILVDDGSDPPIHCPSDIAAPFLTILHTGDTRPWTWALARNAGARIASGEYLLMFDLDYILTREALEGVRGFTGQKRRFRREFGVLDEHGEFSQDEETMKRYGLPEQRIKQKGFKLPPHPNNFAILRELYWEIGGFREDVVDRPYPQGEDRYFKQEWMKRVATGEVEDDDANTRPTLYMFPNGQFCGDVDYNPFDLFHDLTRKTDRNPWHKRCLKEGAR